MRIFISDNRMTLRRWSVYILQLRVSRIMYDAAARQFG